MKFKLYKNTLLVFCFTASLGVAAQKTSKKFSESFQVNKDVEVKINASNTEINVSTWNKNQVLVEAFIEVEGLSKKEAEKYLNSYQFKALGNKNLVEINSKSLGNFHGLNNFVIFNNDDFEFPEIIIPEIPEIELPHVEAIVIPEVDFDKIFMDFDFDFDFDAYEKDGKNYFFQWKDGARKLEFKSKKEWKKFKESKEYKEWKEDVKDKTQKAKKEFKKSIYLLRDSLKFTKEQKDRIKESVAKARESVRKIDMSKVRIELDKAREELGKRRYEFSFNTDSDEMTINGKKVKIKKRLEIKVPKNATFDLNTRHCKVKLPKSKASGKVSYGSFNATGIDGGELKISFSPVSIVSLNQANLVLNNVTDASLASVTNSIVTSTSGSLKIAELLNDVQLSTSYADVEIVKVDPNITKLNINLEQSDAMINLLNFKNKLTVKTTNSNSSIKKNPEKKRTQVQGSFVVEANNNNLIQILGRYSELIIKK